MFFIQKLVCLFVIFCFAFATPLESAARGKKKSKRFNALVKKAKDQYESEKFEKSAETLIKAYNLKPVPKLLYNIARSYDKADNSDQATRYYQRYIDSPNNEPELVRNAANRMAELREAQTRAELENQRKLEDEQRKAEEERKQLEAERKKVQEDAEQRKKDEEERRRLEEEEAAKATVLPLVLGISGGVVAVAALAAGGTGGYFGLGAQDARTSWEGASGLDDKKSYRDTAISNALYADIAFIGAGVLAAVAGGLVAGAFLTMPAEEEATATEPPAAKDEGAEEAESTTGESAGEAEATAEEGATEAAADEAESDPTSTSEETKPEEGQQ